MSFSNDNGDGKENVKTALGLLSKTTSLHVHHAFLYMSLSLLHNHDVKMPNFTFSGLTELCADFSEIMRNFFPNYAVKIANYAGIMRIAQYLL